MSQRDYEVAVGVAAEAMEIHLMKAMHAALVEIAKEYEGELERMRRAVLTATSLEQAKARVEM